MGKVYATLSSYDKNVRDELIGRDLGWVRKLYNKLKTFKQFGPAGSVLAGSAGSSQLGHRFPCEHFSNLDASQKSMCRSDVERAKRMKLVYERHFAAAAASPELDQLKMEWLKLTNFIGISEANIHIMKEMLNFFAQLCGETHGDDWLEGGLPDWLNPTRWGDDIYVKHIQAVYDFIYMIII